MDGKNHDAQVWTHDSEIDPSSGASIPIAVMILMTIADVALPYICSVREKGNQFSQASLVCNLLVETGTLMRIMLSR